MRIKIFVIFAVFAAMVVNAVHAEGPDSNMRVLKEYNIAQVELDHLAGKHLGLIKSTIGENK